MEVPSDIKPCIPELLNPPLNVQLVKDEAGLDALAGFFSRVDTFGYDTETNVVDRFYTRKIRTLQFGDKNEQYVVDLWELAGRDTDYLKSIQGHDGASLPRRGIFWKLRDVLSVLDSPNWLKVGHNLGFDYIVTSWCLGIFPWNFWDTYIAEKVRWAGLYAFMRPNFWGLEDLVRRYMKLEVGKEEQKTFWPETDILTPLTTRQLNYAGLDVRLPIGLRVAQYTVLEKEELLPTMRIENNAVPAFGDMHVNGFYLDPTAWMERVKDNEEQHIKNIAECDKHFTAIVGKKGSPPTSEELKALDTEVVKLTAESPEELTLKQRISAIRGAGSAEQKVPLRAQLTALQDERKAKRTEARTRYKDASKLVTWYRNEASKMEGEVRINYDSPKQVREALLKVKGVTEKKLKDTNDKTLNKFADRIEDEQPVFETFPIIGALVNYRETKKRKKSYGAEYLRYIDPDTGRIHADFDQLAAETGRTACRNPGLQQVPKLKEWRACFKARPGWKLSIRDLEGCELRLMADAAGEPAWILAFKNNEDIHMMVAFNIAEATEPGKWKDEALEGCVFILSRKKCKCPKHKSRRDKAKAIDFGAAYGLSVYGLMEQLRVDEKTATLFLQAWHSANPTLSAKLEEWGEMSVVKLESRTPIGRRRLFTPVTYERAHAACVKEWKEKKYTGLPTRKHVVKKMIAMKAAIKREGCNHKIQGGNADLTKLAVGSGFDPDGKPYLWHVMRRDRQFALLENLVHDELVSEAPEKNIEEADKLIADALTRAGAEFVKSVVMTTEGHIEDYWRK